MRYVDKLGSVEIAPVSAHFGRRTAAAHPPATASSLTNAAVAACTRRASDLLDEQERVEAAIECLRTVLRTPTHRLILRCYCNEQTNMPKQQITGAVISPQSRRIDQHLVGFLFPSVGT
jgi:hypothetical protein